MTRSTDSVEPQRFRTAGGIDVTLTRRSVDGVAEVAKLVHSLDTSVGVLLSSSYEYPGRYTRWDLGFAHPPLVVACNGRHLWVEALNERGEVLLGAVQRQLKGLLADGVAASLERAPTRLDCHIAEPAPGVARFAEEERSRQPSVFSAVRAIVELFGCDDEHLGLYGAFGYDLAFQFEPIPLRLDRPADGRDLVLFLPDELLVVDHQANEASRLSYEFAVDGARTDDLARVTPPVRFDPASDLAASRDQPPGAYAAGVERARERFAVGDLFEVVTSQLFVEPTSQQPSELFGVLKERNPSPYGFLISLGASEWLVGASPEMYVRVNGSRVETAPISGTVARGTDPHEDASQILALLNSEKDESELTMCTDVDRNDKSRICVPGSVKVIGRRQIEMYSRLIHTVDHVDGTLLGHFDALDAFLTHTWAVTVTGAPKAAAMAFIEATERSPRAWYGGAVGKVGFDGSLNTGLTLRTIRLVDGMAQVRVGATLLWESDPDAEERETELKASAFLDAVRRPAEAAPSTEPHSLLDRSVLLVDHQDSFVHTLASYLRQTGASVVTRRAGFDLSEIAHGGYDLVVLSPGPGRPSDFAVSATIAASLAAGVAVFGVCLGLQGIVEHFGGTLGQLDAPVHGKPSEVVVAGGRLAAGLPARFKAGRYHSLFAVPADLPAELRVTATTDDGVVMAVEHTTLPVAAVQFHPESIMSLEEGVGMALVRNAVEQLDGETWAAQP